MSIQEELYKEFGVHPELCSGRASDAKRKKIDRIHQYFMANLGRAKSPADMRKLIEDEWTAGLGPIATWLMWAAIRMLIKQVVIWLWNRYSK